MFNTLAPVPKSRGGPRREKKRTHTMKLICSTCNKDVNAPGFICDARVCPLDKFTAVGRIEVANGKARITRIPPECPESEAQGGPAPSDSPIRIEP